MSNGDSAFHEIATVFKKIRQILNIVKFFWFLNVKYSKMPYSNSNISRKIFRSWLHDYFCLNTNIQYSISPLRFNPEQIFIYCN